MADRSIAEQIREIYENYNRELAQEVKRVTEEVAKETANELKANSRKRPGDKYAKGWKAKAEGGTVAKGAKAVVHNTTAPQLTHLLENGHIIKNQYGQYPGRVNGDGVIAAANSRAEANYINKLKGIF